MFNKIIYSIFVVISIIVIICVGNWSAQVLSAYFAEEPVDPAI